MRFLPARIAVWWSRRAARRSRLRIGTVPTRVVTEDCKSLDQSFRNTYWVSVKSGAIVQARQWAGDEVGYLMTKAAAR